MSYLKLAKEAEARLRATTPGYEYDERNERTPPSGLAEEYRQVLRRLFTLVAAGAEAPLEACQAAVQEEIRLTDELGPALADRIHQAEATAWRQATARCPYCGEFEHREGR